MAAVVVAVAGQVAAAAKAPSFIIMLADDMGWGDVSSFPLHPSSTAPGNPRTPPLCRVFVSTADAQERALPNRRRIRPSWIRLRRLVLFQSRFGSPFSPRWQHPRPLSCRGRSQFFAAAHPTLTSHPLLLVAYQTFHSSSPPIWLEVICPRVHLPRVLPHAHAHAVLIEQRLLTHRTVGWDCSGR